METAIGWQQKFIMVSDKFRHQLRQEAELWKAEGLIDAGQYQQLSERYQLSTLETVARNRFITILVGLGSILLGLGVITFVAANWQVWPRELKVTLLLSLFIAVNVAGFYLWKRPVIETRHGTFLHQQQQLGQGLLLFGSLILGANMALMSQMFHINRSGYELFLSWGLGVLAMAYSLRLNSLGVLAILLIGLGYLKGVHLSAQREFSWLGLMLEHMPLIASLMLVPLAYWCRSQAIFILAAILVVISLELNIAALGSLRSSRGWSEAIAFTLTPALLWAYRDLWPSSSSLFQPIARNLALLFLSITFYTFSFHLPWEATSAQPHDQFPVNWLPLIDVVLLSGLTAFSCLHFAYSTISRPSRRDVDLNTKFVVYSIAITSVVFLWHFGFRPIPVIAVTIFNGLLFLIAAGLIHHGLSQEQRSSFRSGIVLLALQILSRLLEYDTGLLFKSLIFLLCGVGVIAAGLWFERHLSTSTSSEQDSL